MTVLATSRQPLHISTERVYTVSPLAVDEAVALFVDRARARGTAFALTDESADAVADICARVDGLPLAVELAAGRVGVLAPRELAARLADALAILDRGSQDAPERHQTLRATLDWSFEILTEPERAAFTALAAFVAGCDVDAAEAVTEEPLSVLENLVDKSLATAHAGRLTLLEPVRQYAAERLVARPDAEAVRERHLAYYMRFARETERAITVRTRSAPEFRQVERERENLRVAIEFALAAGRPVDALTLVGDLGVYCWSAEPDAELHALAQQALAEAGTAPRRLRARAMFTLTTTSDYSDARLASAEATLELFRAAGDETEIVRALILVSNMTTLQGGYSAARAVAVEALERARAVGDDLLIGSALAQVAFGTAGAAEAAALVREAAAHLRKAGALQIAATVLTSAGMAALREDAYDVASALEYEALDTALTAHDPYSLAFVYGNLGLAALLGDRPEAAAQAFRDELVTARAHNFGLFYFEGLLGIAALAAADGDDRRAAVLEAAAFGQLDRPVFESERPVYDRITERFLTPARERLGPKTWAEAGAAGRTMRIHDAFALALGERGVAELLPD